MGFPISNYDLLRQMRGEDTTFDVLICRRTTGPGGKPLVPGDIIKDCPRSLMLLLINGGMRAHGMIGFDEEDVKAAKKAHADREKTRLEAKAEERKRRQIPKGFILAEDNA